MSKPRRHLEVTYCDDIRQEVGGKISLMGIYTGDMYVTGMPLLLPKLCIAINVVTSIDNPIQSLKINIFKEGVTEPMLSTGEIVVPELPRDDNSVWQVAHLMFALSPFQIDEETKLRVIAETESGEIIGRSLKILKTTDPERVH